MPAIVGFRDRPVCEFVLTSGDTHYEVLGVPPSADVATLRRAYVSKARIYHPDFHIREDAVVREAAEARMRSLNGAWETLGQSTKREKYDRELKNTGRFEPGVPNGSTSGRSNGGLVQGPEKASYSALPRWLIMAPALCLIMAFGFFVVGFVTGLAGLLAAGLTCVLVGAVGFIVVPMVALKRSKRE